MNVFLTLCSGYDQAVSDNISELLHKTGCRPVPGTRVLVKPNLIARRYARLACTRVEVVLGVCSYLLDCGAQVEVGDSPAFGSAPGVAKSAGLSDPLKRMGIQVAPLDRPRPVPLSFGGHIGISARVLDADLIINLPKLKAHSQMRITGAVKNFFGTVCGFRKAWAHSLHGDKGNRFQSVLVETMLAAPPSVTVMDAIECMHVRGPLDGEPYMFNMLAASTSPVAVDTTAYDILGLTPDEVPLWRECLDRDMAEAHMETLSFPMAAPEEFDGSGFQVPPRLKPMTFHPLRLIRGRLKSLRQHLSHKLVLDR